MEELSEAGTRERIIAVVEELMMERGFNAISYQDVSDRIGIRKASIHYHFPGKGDLGVAVIRQYTGKMQAATQALAATPEIGHVSALSAFLDVFASVSASPRKVCLGGVLGAEFETLPEAMQQEVRAFYETTQRWLGQHLEDGRSAGVFTFEGSGEAVARAIVSCMEGALIVGRALGGKGQIDASLWAAHALTGVSKS